jgi:RNA polymerase sigma factor (sigma-70 family)
LDYGDLFQDWEIALAKGLISQFQADHPWLRPAEFDDLLQECLSHWHVQRGRFKSERGASIRTYMRTVLTNWLRSLLRRELSAKRRIHRVTLSLDEPLDDDGTTLGDVISADTPDVSERVDVAAVVNGLTPEQKQICQLLSGGLSTSEIAAVLGKPRHIVRREMGIIRHAFQRQGFRGTRT